MAQVAHDHLCCVRMRLVSQSMATASQLDQTTEPPRFACALVNRSEGVLDWLASQELPKEGHLERLHLRQRRAQ